MVNAPIGECTLYLDLMQKGRYAGEDVSPPEQCLPMLHEFGDGMFAISDTLLQLGGDKGDRFGLIELETARETLLREKAGLAVRGSVRMRHRAYTCTQCGDLPDAGRASLPPGVRYAC